jgi:hypothetical protein
MKIWEIKVHVTCSESANIMKTTPVRDKAPLPDPSKEGTDHINVHYNYGKKLGRLLSTYQVERFEHPYFGPFKCVEGFMLYVKTGCRDDEFRYLTGARATAHFRKQMNEGNLKINNIDNGVLVHLLISAYHARLVQHPVTAAQFKESTLPFDFYFLYEGSGLPVRPENAALLIHALMTLREYMKRDLTPPLMSSEEYAKLIVR